jgi:hypothetical protein
MVDPGEGKGEEGRGREGKGGKGRGRGEFCAVTIFS